MILDLIVVAIFLLLIVIGAVKGAARMLFNLASDFAAYLVGAWLAGLAAANGYRLLIRPAITKIVEDSVSNMASGLVTQVEMPFWLKSALRMSGSELASPVELAAAASQKAVTEVDKAVEPIIVGFISIALTILLFFVIRFILRKLLMEPVLALFKAPVVNTLNRFLGGAIGAVEGLLIVSMLAYLLKLLLPHMAEPPAFLDESTIYNSFILYHFYSGNIFTILTSWVFK